MPDALPDIARTVFAKTEAGQMEIKTRALGLSPKLRSVLIMVDGHRTGADLAALTGPDLDAVVGQLVAQGCVEVVSVVGAAEPAPQAAPAAPAPAAAASAETEGLPPPEARSAKEIEMARNFMINTINTMFGQNMRLSLIESIFACRGAAELRAVYPAWAEAMAESRAGSKRLPELRQKLFEVL
ncbi:MAG: hypothetical protein KF740_14180 [Ramlibacter sp.]|nr:hypothetical protein [Ramlibacter sp.]